MSLPIQTDQPSSGKSIIIAKNITTSNTWTTILEANNFSVPIRNEDTANVDPGPDRSTCEIIPGELFISAPLFVCNTGNTPVYVQLRISSEAGGFFLLTPRMTVPTDESIQIPIQGQVLLKTIYNPTLIDGHDVTGDRLQITVSEPSIDLYGTATESEASVHDKYTEAQ